MKISKNGQSVQDLIGIRNFTEQGLSTNYGELIFFAVSPTNISVMSRSAVASKIDNLMTLLSVIPDIEIVCTDASECFDANNAHLKNLICKEKNVLVKDLISKDITFLNQVQSETATARQFMIIARCRNMKPEQVFQTANKIAKAISDRGFEFKKMGNPEIKRLLALYFDASLDGERLPDQDGEQYFEFGNGFGDYVRQEDTADE